MIVTIRSPGAKRNMIVKRKEDFEEQIKRELKVESFSLFADSRRTIPYDLDNLKHGEVIYMSYETKGVTEYKKEFTCTHGPDGVCPKCCTLDPLDRKRNEGMKVKYLSRKGYEEMLKEKNSSEDKFDYEKKECTDHGKNVRCMKCMEKAILLSPQIFRWIDYVEFEGREMVERFIGRWRDTRKQRIGLLVGRREKYNMAYEGVKAVVSGIWEVTQEDFPDGAALENVPGEFIWNGLEILGVIYTNIYMRDGHVYNYKITMDYTMSAMELKFLHDVQESIGKEGFVGISVEADTNSDIVLECFMLSEQFKALLRAGFLELSTDPRMFWTERDISYIEKNEYDKDVRVRANPLVPVEYFIVRCETGYSNTGVFTNNTVIERCTPRKLSNYFNGDYSMERFQSFDVLVNLAPILENTPDFFSAVVKGDKKRFEELKQTEAFIGFRNKLEKFTDKKWACSACTYLNEAYRRECFICQTSK